jgi:hypothetical protein
MPRAVAHEQAIAQRRAAERIPWRRREARVIAEHLRLRVATNDDGGMLRATLAHEAQVEDVAVALTLSRQEVASVPHEWQRASDQREAKAPRWR